MSKKLIIVESPAKARTIKKYLGSEFEVLASYGHVRDLVPKEGAVQPDDDFAMRYQIIEKNEKHVDAIARALKKADALYVATDPDREGEAIAWHLCEILEDRGALDGKPVYRVVFHEITRAAIKEALAHTRDLSKDLVSAQQARRALDYLVGFNLSPLLWKKIKRGLSAGRVQSPALRMIVEREGEIAAFEPREYWTLEAKLTKKDQGLTAKLAEYNGEKVEQFSITNEAQAEEARGTLERAANGMLRVLKIDKKQRRRNPAPPFTTSTMQQEASRKLGFSAQKTMMLAQRLYEGVDVGEGAVGLISYMRTDSVTLAGEALDDIRSTINELYGEENLPEEPRQYKTTAKNAQEAHEAIRPTSASNTPESLDGKLDRDQHRLYTLIWKRTIACQMTPAVYDTVAVDLLAGPDSQTRHRFRATGSTLVKPGFISVYLEGKDEKAEDESEKTLPRLEEGESVDLAAIDADQHFTEPPPRYTEASLVKALEEYGIGRPSTYASIISTLKNREYVEMESRRFIPTDVAKIVNGFLTQHFSQYVDYDFTARMEDSLDEISRGEKEWVPLMRRFWRPFEKLVHEKEKTVSREEVAQARELGIDPKSGRPVSVRMGRYGPFVQIGTRDDEEKPKFAGLRPGQKMDDVELEDALALFQLPRELGETEDGEPVSTNIGRYGPYVRYGDKFVSIKDEDPYTITLERALEVIREKKEADAKRLIQDFPDEGIQVLNGRYGPYVTNKAKNARVPKDKDPAKLTLEECTELLAQAPVRGRRRTKKQAAEEPKEKAAPAKKTPRKKKTTRKKAARKKTKKKAARKAPGRPAATT